MKNKALPILALGAVFISFSGIWVKLAHVPSPVSAFYRVCFGFLFLLPTTFFRKELRPKPAKKYGLGLACAVFFAADLYFWHYSIQFIGPGLSTLIANFQVIGLALIGVVVFKENLGFSYILAIPLALLGLYLIVGIDWHVLGADYKKGVYYGFATALCYIGFLITLKRLQSDKNDFSIFYYLMLVSFFTSLILGAMVTINGQSFAIPDWQSFFALLLLGLFSQFLGWVMIANTLPHINTSFAGLVLLLQPSLAFVWDVLFFSRPTGPLNWAGVFITLSAIYLGMGRK